MTHEILGQHAGSIMDGYRSADSIRQYVHSDDGFTQPEFTSTFLHPDTEARIRIGNVARRFLRNNPDVATITLSGMNFDQEVEFPERTEGKARGQYRK